MLKESKIGLNTLSETTILKINALVLLKYISVFYTKG